MTMPRGASRALYAGNGQAVEFPFFFKVFEEDQLSVHITSPAGVTSEAAGWTAELDEDGGTVRYLHHGSALPEGWKLAIVRDMPFVQEVDLITGTRFDPEVIETALDVATAERQQLLERLGRAIVVEPTDEGGPEELKADIFTARDTAVDSAAGASASATAAAESARSAAGSAAIATEEREAACICAQESRAARDVAIAQTEAANTLMEAELAKVNAIVAANKTDQQAAVTAARAWAEKAPDMPVEYDEAGNAHYSAQHWADRAQKLANNPDGETITVDANGVLKVLGGNLQCNRRAILKESGTWTVPVTGWYNVTTYNGGDSAGFLEAERYLYNGASGFIRNAQLYLTKGMEVPYVIGAGGAAPTLANGVVNPGGATTFGEFVFDVGWRFSGIGIHFNAGNSSPGADLGGAGLSGGPAWGAAVGVSQQEANAYLSASGWYGGGGAASRKDGNYIVNNKIPYAIGAGAQGCIIICWYDPEYASGPDAGTESDGPAPALLSARRMASRAAAAEPVTVNLYDPETGQGSVWRGEDAEAKLAEGLITEAAWLAICAARAAEERAAWLANPDTEAERFAMLRAARDARLAATDYLVAPDYPLADAQRAAVTVYRQALRDLPAEEGAPWDGGGELTPWPAMPAGEAAEEGAGGDAPCA